MENKIYTKYRLSVDNRFKQLVMPTKNIEAAKYEIRKSNKLKKVPETLEII